jgi:hypothetical protein
VGSVAPFKEPQMLSLAKVPSLETLGARTVRSQLGLALQFGHFEEGDSG